VRRGIIIKIIMPSATLLHFPHSSAGTRRIRSPSMNPDVFFITITLIPILLHSHTPTGTHAPPSPMDPNVFPKLAGLAAAGDLTRLRAGIEAVDARFPSLWASPPGRIALRWFTVAGTMQNRLEVVKYLCGERGVPPMAFPAQEQGEQSLSSRLSALPYAFYMPTCLFHESLLTFLPAPHSHAAFGMMTGMFAGNQEASFPPLEVAAQLRHTGICLYMLTLGLATCLSSESER